MSKKNEYDMTIYVNHENYDNVISKINASFNSIKNEEKKIVSYWRWFPLTDSLNDNLLTIISLMSSKIKICFDKKNNHKFKEVLIIQNKNIIPEKLDDFFEQLNDILDECGRYFHPFIIFLTEEKINIDYESYDNFDEKKICFLPFPVDEPTFTDLLFKLIQCCSYFNELGDYFEINGYPYQAIPDIETFPTYLNILIAGRSQSGKSTFVNLLLNQKRAKEGGNNCGCSQKPQIYKVLNYPIRLYDTVGFGDEDKNVEDIRNYFKKLDDELLNSKEKIHLILYFIDGNAGNMFSKNEIILLDEIQKKNILIFYIVTKFNFNPNKNAKKYNIELKKIYRSMTSAVGKKNLSDNDDENLKRFFGVNLVKTSPESDIFGFETIIKNIYEFFYKEGIILSVIKDKHKNYIERNEKYDWDDISSILQNNFFFNHLKNYKEIEEKYEQNAKNSLNNAKTKLTYLGWIPFVNAISSYYINKNLESEIEKSFKLNENKDNEINENKKLSSSYNQIFVKNNKKEETEKTLGEKLFYYGKKIVNFPLANMDENGDNLVKKNLEKFREINYNITISLIDSILKGIEFFEKLNSSVNNKISEK